MSTRVHISGRNRPSLDTATGKLKMTTDTGIIVSLDQYSLGLELGIVVYVTIGQKEITGQIIRVSLSQEPKEMEISIPNFSSTKFAEDLKE